MVDPSIVERLDAILTGYEPDEDARESLVIAIASAVLGGTGVYTTSSGQLVPRVGGFANGSHPLLVGNIAGLLMRQDVDEAGPPTKIVSNELDDRVKAGNYTAEFFVDRPSGRYLVQVHCLEDKETEDKQTQNQNYALCNVAAIGPTHPTYYCDKDLGHLGDHAYYGDRKGVGTAPGPYHSWRK